MPDSSVADEQEGHGVSGDDATLAAAEEICSDEPDALGGELPAGTVLDALTRLADKSFLAVDGEAGDMEPRYRMLDTIRRRRCSAPPTRSAAWPTTAQPRRAWYPRCR